MRKPGDKCKTPGRSTGERADRSSEENVVSAPQVERGLNGRYSIPRTTPHSSPSTAFHDRIVEQPRPLRRLSAVGHCYRCAGSAAILNTSPCAARNLFGNNSHKPPTKGFEGEVLFETSSRRAAHARQIVLVLESPKQFCRQGIHVLGLEPQARLFVERPAGPDVQAWRAWRPRSPPEDRDRPVNSTPAHPNRPSRAIGTYDREIRSLGFRSPPRDLQWVRFAKMRKA
jgi:hypothetical protein